MDFIWILIETKKAVKNSFDIYETIGNLNADLVFDDIKEILLFLCVLMILPL